MSLGRLTGLVAVGLLLAAITLLATLGQPPVAIGGSAHSAEDDGRLGLLLLFERLGFEPEVWERPPGELPASDARGPGTLWLWTSPRGYVPDVDEDDPLERARAAGSGAFVHYRSFVERGGRLVLHAGESTESFLERVLGLPPSGPDPGDEGDAEARAEGQRDGTGEPNAGQGLVWIAAEDGPWGELRSEGRLIARRARLGEGDVVLTVDEVHNRRLQSGEGERRALEAVRLVAFEPPAGPLRFDEGALHDRLGSGSAAALAFGPGRVLTWHLAALALLIVWAAAWPREFPRDPQEPAALAPLSRARATADGLVRVGRFGTLSRLLRAGLPAEPAASGPPRLGRPPGSLEELRGRRVMDLESLVELDRALRELEPAGRRARQTRQP